MAKECSLDLTAKDIHGNTIFTEALINELSAYIKSAEYTDEYITQTDDMKFVEIYEQSNKLFDRAKGQLNKLAVQSFTFSVENNSFLFNKKFKRFSDQLCPGAIIYLETSDDHMEQVHLTNFSIDYDEKTVSFTFGNKYDENDIKSLFDDVFGSVKTSAAQIKYLKNVVNDQRSLLQKQQDWIDNAFTLTKDHILTSNNQTVTIDDSGYWGRRQSVDKDGNPIFDTNGNPIYDNEQIKIINNGVYLTTDNWGSIATAIGKIWLYHDDEKNEDVFRYGVAGDIIVGKLFLGKELTLLGNARSDGTYAITLNENGLTIINDGTTAGITIKDANGNKQLYADENGNLYLDAEITAKSGNIAGWTIEPTRITKVIENIPNVGNRRVAMCSDSNSPAFYVTGSDAANSIFKVNWDGSIKATAGTIGGWTINENKLSYVENKVIRMEISTKSDEPLIYAATPGNPFFIVNRDGSVYMKGKIEASSGHIGNWEINSVGLVAKDSKGRWTGLRLPSSESRAYSFFTGATDSSGAGATFVAYSDGSLYATKANITGTITATNSSFSGTVNATDGTFNGTVNANNGHVGCWYINEAYLYCPYTTTQSGTYMEQATVYRRDPTGKETLRSSWDGIIRAGVSTSDARLKKEIVYINDEDDAFFDSLKPVSFKYKAEAIAGSSKLTHFGFIAQDVQKSAEDYNLEDIAAIWTDNDYLNLDKQELIALNTNQIQKLKKKIFKIENTLNELISNN